MSQKSFLDNKKSRKNFPYVGRGGGGNQQMENSICFVVFIFESFPYVQLEKRGHWSQETEPQLVNVPDFQVKVNQSKFIVILSDAPHGTGIIVR